jgi:hypothetical protein
MTRTKNILAIMLAVLVLSALAFASVASANPSDAGGVSFTLVAHPVTENVPLERGFTWTDRIETTDGEVIGWAGGRCLNLNPDPAVFSQYMCDMVMHLPDGDIMGTAVFDIEAIVPGEEFIQFAVTGGTDSFRNARGEIGVIPKDEVSVYVPFRLIGASADY